MPNPSRHTTNVLNQISQKKPNITKEKKDSKEKIKEYVKEDEEDIDTHMYKYQAKHRKSAMSISSTDSLNEDDINEKFKKIVTKIRNNPSKRENNAINIESNLEKEKAKEKV